MANDQLTSAMDPASFETIAKLTYEESGLQLVAEKSSMIQSRLRHRLRALNMIEFKEYSEFLHSKEGVDERKKMISALTTNVSHFFREAHHFDVLMNNFFPRIIDDIRNGARLRIWSAGCSNGQEAYSIVISALEHYPELVNFDFRVLATDIDENVISFARSGKYPERLMSGVSSKLLEKYFILTHKDNENIYTAKNIIRNIITFKEMNLHSDWPMKFQIDIIFCRNVMIYFDLVTQRRLWSRFRTILKDHGYLFLGHSERIIDPSSFGFVNEGPTCYRHLTKEASERRRQCP